jgi:hypothetical protein
MPIPSNKTNRACTSLHSKPVSSISFGLSLRASEMQHNGFNLTRNKITKLNTEHFKLRWEELVLRTRATDIIVERTSLLLSVMKAHAKFKTKFLKESFMLETESTLGTYYDWED